MQKKALDLNAPVLIFTALFVGLKLSGHITWSWWWVLSPIWLSIAFMLAFILVVLLIAVVIALFK